MFSVSTPHRFYSLAPKDDLNIMCPELTGCFYKMECHTTGITSFIIMQEHQMNLLVLSESAGMFKSSGQVSMEKIMCIGALQTSHQLNYKWNIPLRECLLEKVFSLTASTTTRFLSSICWNPTLDKHSNPKKIQHLIFSRMKNERQLYKNITFID